MHLHRILGLLVAFTTLSICLPLFDRITTLLIRENYNAQPQCDSICVRRLLYKVAYASSATGVIETMDAYQSYDWCINEQEDWCQEAINSTISAIAGDAATTVASSIDVDDCGDECKWPSSLTFHLIVNYKLTHNRSNLRLVSN